MRFSVIAILPALFLATAAQAAPLPAMQSQTSPAPNTLNTARSALANGTYVPGLPLAYAPAITRTPLLPVAPAPQPVPVIAAPAPVVAAPAPVFYPVPPAVMAAPAPPTPVSLAQPMAPASVTPPLPLPAAPRAEEAAFGTGWYGALRGGGTFGHGDPVVDSAFAISYGLPFGGGSPNPNLVDSGSDDYSQDIGFFASAAAGYGFAPLNDWISPRAELEIGYQRAGLSDHRTRHTLGGTTTESDRDVGHQSVLTGMANAYLDFLPAAHFLRPYVGAGLGAAHVGTVADDDGFGRGIDQSETVLAYSGQAGVGIALGRGTLLDVGYRYLGSADYDVGFNKTQLSVSTVQIGLRQSF